MTGPPQADDGQAPSSAWRSAPGLGGATVWRMVRVVGDAPRFAHESERVVWEQLCRTAADDTVLVPNMRLTSALKDHELDVVVLMPGVGVVVVEVKGGSVSVDPQGQWWTGAGTRRSRIRPVEQCRDGKYVLR